MSNLSQKKDTLTKLQKERSTTSTFNGFVRAKTAEVGPPIEYP